MFIFQGRIFLLYDGGVQPSESPKVGRIFGMAFPGFLTKRGQVTELLGSGTPVGYPGLG